MGNKCKDLSDFKNRICPCAACKVGPVLNPRASISKGGVMLHPLTR